MPKTSAMRESKFLKKEDVGQGVLVTIRSVEQHNVAKEGAGDEYKWCMTFREVLKPLVLNLTNISSCQEICQSDDTDAWIGHRVVLYEDPNVMYAGQRVGGIRIRSPRGKAAKAKVEAPPPPAPDFDGDDDAGMPF